MIIAFKQFKDVEKLGFISYDGHYFLFNEQSKGDVIGIPMHYFGTIHRVKNEARFYKHLMLDNSLSIDKRFLHNDAIIETLNGRKYQDFINEKI